MASLGARMPGGPEVSVIVPLFGSHRGAQTLPIVTRAWLDQDVPCEVVIAIAGDIQLGVPERAVSQGSLRIVRAPPSACSPGLLRNLAAQSSVSRFLYLSDADVLPLRRDYLRRALILADQPDSKIIAQPWMYRLVTAPEWTALPSWRPPARRYTCFVTADLDGVLTPMEGERFVWQDTYRRFVVPPPGVMSSVDPPRQLPRPPFHWGGLLVDRDLFEAVGGYCLLYKGWGCEDDDLLLKVASRREILWAWRTARALSCLHFEHPRSYAGAGVAANRALLAERTAMGAEAMIRADFAARC